MNNITTMTSKVTNAASWSRHFRSGAMASDFVLRQARHGKGRLWRSTKVCGMSHAITPHIITARING
jgi:hypothetical protein